MDYRLAKELKDAGFTQQSKASERYLIPEDKVRFDFTMMTWDKEMFKAAGISQKNLLSGDELERVKAYCPTLEELITACGKDFQKLEAIVGDKWQGVGGTGIRDIEVEGNTPAEAVARLWLTLNKK